MFFSKRVKKSFEVMQERNRRYLESMKEPDTGSPDAEGAEEEENLLSVSGEIPAGDPGIEAQAEREIEEEIREDDGTGENGGPVDELPDEGLETEGKQARRMRYAAVRDPAADEAEGKAEEFHREENKLEKGDIPAMILSAILVFGPIFLVLGGILALAWIFLH